MHSAWEWGHYAPVQKKEGIRGAISAAETSKNI
jgi:hypothetical protein